jgi:FAD/FMN-containing dehydrogenase
MSDIIERLGRIVGASHVLSADGDMAGYLSEPRDLYRGRALCVVRPGSTAEVAAVLKLCDDAGLRVTPQGGNTGLVGGQTPMNARDVLISTTRLDKVREIDLPSNTMTVEAGVTLLRVQEEAERVDRLFPLSLASEGSCTIGGNLASNAGGTAVLAYGNARDLVTGVEVVLADGRVLSLLSKLKKDNTGYDLKHLFMGSEGTLGVVTAAVVKLYPRPRAVETALVGLASPQKALAFLNLAQDMAGADLKTYEFMARIGMDFVLRHAPDAREPMEGKHAWYVLIELASQGAEGLDARMMGLLEAAFERDLIEDASVAASLDQRKALWAYARKNLAGNAETRRAARSSTTSAVPVASSPGLHGRRRPRPWMAGDARRARRAPSAISATATSTTTSRSRSACRQRAAYPRPLARR